MSSSSCIVGRPSLVRVCWVSFGAWLLGRSNYDCIWLSKFPSLLCIEGKSQAEIIPICVSSDGRMPCFTIFHDCLRLLVLAGMHPACLVELL
jgi:hypothetical protein